MNIPHIEDNRLFAYNICAAEAADIKELPPNTVLISINEEIGELYPLQIPEGDERLLRLRFSDVPGLELKYKHNLEQKTYELHNIRIKDTEKAIEFIERNKNKSFWIHCAAGVSRSAAVSLFIHTIYGHKLKPMFFELSCTNVATTGILLNCYTYKKLKGEL